jgi:hypothetical protein
MSFTTHLECSLCQIQYPIMQLINLCRCGSHNRMVRAVLRAADEMAAE